MPRRETNRRAKVGRRRAHGPPSERYQLGIDDEEIDQLAAGVCPETIALKCWEMLKWQREAKRNRAREWHEAADRGRRR
jgi:hypothetical protein